MSWEVGQYSSGEPLVRLNYNVANRAPVKSLRRTDCCVTFKRRDGKPEYITEELKH